METLVWRLMVWWVIQMLDVSPDKAERFVQDATEGRASWRDFRDYWPRPKG